jgi:hypothetical protein
MMNDADLAEVRADRERRARALGITESGFKCATCRGVFTDFPIYINTHRQPLCDEHGFPPDHNQEQWERIPAHLRDGLRAYMMEFRRPGKFLCCVLENDLAGALGRADAGSILGIKEITTYLFSCAPPKCYGSVDAVDAWCARPIRHRLERSLGQSPS